MGKLDWLVPETMGCPDSGVRTAYLVGTTAAEARKKTVVGHATDSADFLLFVSVGWSRFDHADVVLYLQMMSSWVYFRLRLGLCGKQHSLEFLES